MCLWVLEYCNVSLDNTSKNYSSGLGFLESYGACVHFPLSKTKLKSWKNFARCAPLFFMTPDFRYTLL